MNNTTPSILLVGAGGIGSRHLQGLVGIDRPLAVQVVDPNEQSRLNAKSLADQTMSEDTTLSFHQSLTDIDNDIDVAVIATQARVRLAVLQQLLTISSPQALILEKFLFQRQSEYHIASELIDQAGTCAWVNCPRRLYPGYQQLRELVGPGPVSMGVSATARFGIGTTAIHFLDAHAYLSGQGDYVMDGSLMDAIAVDTKREGVPDISGTVLATNSQNGRFGYTAYLESTRPVRVMIDSPAISAVVDEGRGRMLISGQQNKWSWEDEPFPVLYQSQLSGPVIEDLIDTGDCGLTPFAESAALHQSLLAVLLQHPTAEGDRTPIT